METDLWAKLAKENANKRIDVKGTLEYGKDGYVELCLFDNDGKQVVHTHGKTNPEHGRGFTNTGGCWFFVFDKLARHENVKRAEQK